MAEFSVWVRSDTEPFQLHLDQEKADDALAEAAQRGYMIGRSCEDGEDVALPYHAIDAIRRRHKAASDV
jgi:hypothetical protein